ncbi:MAG: deoxyribonuclease IV [Chloroflexi bacterium]|nr:deoxyribonuclease IV [Chloroflexota bacterium]
MKLRLGAHLNGGVKGALDHARRIGLGHGTGTGGGHGYAGEGGPIQLWSRNPSAWKCVTHAPADVARFREGCAALELDPIFTHGIYLMNFASPDDALWARSVDALVDQLVVGAQLGARAVIVHPGSGITLEHESALDRCAVAVRRALERTEDVDGRPLVALETCAGAGKTIGRTFGDLAAILARLDQHPGVAIALDTAHLYGSGYDVATPEGLDAVVKGMLEVLPVERIVVVHANDSKVALGSHKDRHENIGQGTIGEEAFARMLAHPVLHPLPWILEVPGYDGTGPDADNLATLRRLAREA